MDREILFRGKRVGNECGLWRSYIGMPVYCDAVTHWMPLPQPPKEETP